MGYRRVEVVAAAIAVLDRDGLAELSMRRVAAELGVQASALYHHFPGKEALLSAVAAALLERGRRGSEVVTWEAELRLICTELRDVMQSHRDADALLARVYDDSPAGPVHEPEQRMADALRRGGADADVARVGARTLLRYTFAHVADDAADFALGLAVLLAGLSDHVARRTRVAD